MGQKASFGWGFLGGGLVCGAEATLGKSSFGELNVSQVEKSGPEFAVKLTVSRDRPNPWRI